MSEASEMTHPYVIAGKCLDNGPQCGECVMYCPTEAIHGGEHYAYIDPVYCIECGACIDICKDGVIAVTEPVYVQGRRRRLLPLSKADIIALNARLAQEHRNN